MLVGTSRSSSNMPPLIAGAQCTSRLHIRQMALRELLVQIHRDGSNRRPQLQKEGRKSTCTARRCTKMSVLASHTLALSMKTECFVDHTFLIL